MPAWVAGAAYVDHLPQRAAPPADAQLCHWRAAVTVVLAKHSAAAGVYVLRRPLPYKAAPYESCAGPR